MLASIRELQMTSLRQVVSRQTTELIELPLKPDSVKHT
jgi:hypothetical protein